MNFDELLAEFEHDFKVHDYCIGEERVRALLKKLAAQYSDTKPDDGTGMSRDEQEWLG